ncbi:MAG: glycosyltransferase [Candidatus Omnitrophota bacterium]|nr:MAG: glycosyltransferase [Candidatus Omnitrophota bacterium]
MKRILIFYISDFGGHSKAAENIKEAFRYKEPEAEVLSINGFGHFYPYWEKVVDFLYTLLIKYIPDLWGGLYDRRRVVKFLTPCRRFVNRITFKKLSRLINDFKPTCFVTTQAFPCGLVADFKQKFGLKIPLVAVVTDYYPHRFWIHPCIDKYVVACKEAKETLVREGVGEEKIKVLGIPISVEFLKAYSRQEVCDNLNFASKRDSVLIMGGGLGIGPIKKIAQQLDSLDSNFQIVVVCGKNKTLYNWFEKNKKDFKKPIFCFGYIDFVHKIMDFSDIIITKAGGITVSEALAKSLCIIIVNPIPGQEERNVNYLLYRGAVVKVDNTSLIGEAVKGLMRDRKRMFYLKEKARENSFIDSSLRIVDLISGEIISG